MQEQKQTTKSCELEQTIKADKAREFAQNKLMWGQG